LGSSGQLGHGGTKNLSNAAQVTAVIRNHKIVHAAAGISHTVLISSKGEVFVCGKCHEDTRIITIPRKVQSLEGVSIIKAIAGVSRTVLIGRDGRGYWSGEGIGHRRNVATDVPIQMEDLDEPLIDAAIGNSHIILKMKSGRYMSIGKNGRYQTGIHTNEQEPILYYTYIPNI
jgi:alpha-tubulin suppressor-like RCC1 family protein